MSEANSSLRYGFDLDRQFFLDFTYRFQIGLTIGSALTIHPAVLYFLLFKSKSCGRDIRIGYIWNTIVIILNEWYISIAFRPYFIFPYDAIYCDGPICRMDLPKRFLIMFFVFFIVMEILPFLFLLLRLHQSFVRMNNKPQMSMRWQLLFSIISITPLFSMIVAWALFARDSDQAPAIMEEPEIQWLLSRGGTVFMFGRPGNAQYFKYAVISIGVAAVVLSPIAYTFMTQSVALVKKVRDKRYTRNTDDAAKRTFAVLMSQMLNTAVVFMLPIIILCLFTFIDTSSIPGVVFAPMRSSILLLFCLNPTQTSLVFLLKNPVHKKYIQDTTSSILRRTSILMGFSGPQRVQDARSVSEPTFTTAWAN